ncbi:hypothetical protein P4662_29195 [Priestia megaterium]|nr:hypothetical protein [Priestia megaterium]
MNKWRGVHSQFLIVYYEQLKKTTQDAIEHRPTTGYHEFNVQKKTTSLNREELSFPISSLYTIFETSYHNKHSKKEANKKETLYQELFS